MGFRQDLCSSPSGSKDAHGALLEALNAMQAAASVGHRGCECTFSIRHTNVEFCHCFVCLYHSIKAGGFKLSFGQL